MSEHNTLAALIDKTKEVSACVENGGGRASDDGVPVQQSRL